MKTDIILTELCFSFILTPAYSMLWNIEGDVKL